MPTPNREVFDGKRCLLPELVMLGHNNSRYTRAPRLAAHTHFHVFEVFYLERGEVEWWTGDEQHRVSAGQIYINRPGERHGSVGSGLQPCSYIWVQLKADPSNFLPGVPTTEAREIFHALNEVSPRCFPASLHIRQHFETLLNEARQPKQMSAVIMRANLHLLLAQVVIDARQQTPVRHSPAIRKAMQFIADNLENELSPSLLAEHVGLSLGHFRECFRDEIGFTPHAYIIRQRIQAAKTLLSNDEYSIAEVSRRYGFCSSQHFATVFKKIEGVTPSQLRIRRSEVAAPIVPKPQSVLDVNQFEDVKP